MATLIRPPPVDETKSAIENVLELTRLSDIDPDLFTNTRTLWHPPGAKGIFGGAAIAQCLSAAQATVPDDFAVHSMHCYFVLSGDPEIPVIYHVEHVREGKSYSTRTVQARQRGKVIFTTTLSFMRENSAGRETVTHAVPMPEVPPPDDDVDDVHFPHGKKGPFECKDIGILNDDSPHPHEKKTRLWIKATGRISANGGHRAHLSALAYMSDSYFIGTVARVHKLQFSRKRPAKANARDGASNESRTADETVTKASLKFAERLTGANRKSAVDEESRPELKMMVSLDHSIYFHLPRAFRADEWMYTEMQTPWAGDGRGLVFQRVFSRDGRLVATCVQEGVVRIVQSTESKL